MIHLRNIFFLFLIPILCCTGCDDGRIHDAESDNRHAQGEKVTVSFTLYDSHGCNDYPVSVAIFPEESDYALVSRNIAESENEVTLSNIPPEGAVVEICLLSPLRKRVATFYSAAVVPGESSEINAGEVNVSEEGAIVTGVFNTSCVRCHGAGSVAAAGLDLAAIAALRNLVNIPSSVEEGKMRVDPGNPGQSTLWLALTTDISDSWAFRHKDLIDETRLKLIRHWIENCQKEN